MNLDLGVSKEESARVAAEAAFADLIRRLVKGAAELQAIDAGQVDAILDPATGTAILLPPVQAVTVLPASDRFARAALEALAAPLCVLDPYGTVIVTNQAWRLFAATTSGIGAGVVEGSNYLAQCDRASGDERADGVAMAAGIRQVIAGERASFRYEYDCSSAVGRCWFVATVTRLHANGTAPVVISYETLTEIKNAKRLLKLEYAVARILAKATDQLAAVQAVIRAVCETQNWECGRYFRLDPAAGVLHLDGSWGLTVAAVEQFMEKSRGTVFRPGAGLAGRVCQSGQPLWILNSEQDRHRSQSALAHEIGLDGAFVIPIIADNQTIGVLAFASRTVREPDDRLLQAVRAIGEQLGEFLRRCQAEDTLRRSEASYRRLTELSSDWVWEQDSNFRFTRIAGRGIAGTGEVLGKTLWELPTIVLSEDDWIKHKAELAAQWSFCDFECAAALADGQLAYYLISGEPVYDEAGVFTGFHGTGLDITRRKRAELSSSEEGR